MELVKKDGIGAAISMNVLRHSRAVRTYILFCPVPHYLKSCCINILHLPHSHRDPTAHTQAILGKEEEIHTTRTSYNELLVSKAAAEKEFARVHGELRAKLAAKQKDVELQKAQLVVLQVLVGSRK